MSVNIALPLRREHESYEKRVAAFVVTVWQSVKFEYHSQGYCLRFIFCKGGSCHKWRIHLSTIPRFCELTTGEMNLKINDEIINKIIENNIIYIS